MSVVTQYSEIPFEIFTIDNIFTNGEIAAWDEYVSQASVHNRRFTSTNFKNGKVVEPEISHMLYNRIAQFLPTTYKDRMDIVWEYCGSPKHIMYAEVVPGQSFPLHTDTGCYFDPPKESKYTLLLFLNNKFTGGYTNFYTRDFKPTVQIEPKMGRILCFDIELFHEGAPVISGVKRWIGTEIICDRKTT